METNEPNSGVAGAANPDNNIATNPTNKPQGDTSQESGDNLKAEPTANERVFTQEDVDRIVSKRLKEAQAKWEKSKDLTELERLKAENDELRNHVRLSRAFESFEKVAQKHGVRNVRGLFKVLREDFEFTPSGELKDVETVLKQARADYPEFFVAANQKAAEDLGAKSNAPGTTMNDIIRRSFGFK